MSQRRVNVGFSDPDEYEFIAREAAEAGVSVNEFIRVAGFSRAMFSYCRRHPRGPVLWEGLYSAAERVEREGDTLDPSVERTPTRRRT